MLLLFVPQFLLSFFSTLNFRDKSSLKILYRHPSLIVLPTVTFFNFSRLNSIDSRVSFSTKFTYVNIAVTTVGYVVWGVWWYFGPFGYNIADFYILFVALPSLVLSILLTALFLHLDKLCCCCCNPMEQLSVYDPDLDRRFIMVNGEVVEDPEDDEETPEDDVETPEDDVETGSNTCCGWCRHTEKQQTDDSEMVPLEVSGGGLRAEENN